MTSLLYVPSTQGVSQDSKTGRPKIFLGVAKYFRGRGRIKSVLGRCNRNCGYVHTVTFLHGFVLFHNPKGVPIYFQTIENDAKTLPCAHSLKL